MSQPNRKTQTSTITLLDKGCEFNGKLSFEGIVRIDGVFQGEIFSQDHLIIGEGAVVEANVQVGELEVSGQLKGQIFCREKLTVHATGNIQGTLQTKNLEVQAGGLIDGTVDMRSLRDGVTDSPKKLEETIVRFNPRAL